MTLKQLTENLVACLPKDSNASTCAKDYGHKYDGNEKFCSYCKIRNEALRLSKEAIREYMKKVVVDEGGIREAIGNFEKTYYEVTGRNLPISALARTLSTAHLFKEEK